VCGVDVIGVPYQQGCTVAESMTGVTAEPLQTTLIAHATVTDAIGAFAGEGEDGAYMPVLAAELFKRFSYTALGHLHSGRNLVRRNRERQVAYAGSPVATSRREIGPRGVLLVDFEPGTGVVGHQIVPLAVPYYERTEVICTPGSEADAIDRLARQAAAVKKPGIHVLARLAGVSTESEASLRESATAALLRACNAAASPEQTSEVGPTLELAVTSYAALASSPVVAEFVSRLTLRHGNDAEKDSKLVEAALRIGLGAFLESLS
jgi:DNA repair exonuclease SbcCD nuclease subunit